MKHWWLVALSVLGISGCVGYGGTFNETVFADYPKTKQLGPVTEPYSPPIIDSLTPTLRWNPINEPLKSDKYDIVIHETYRHGSLTWAIGPEVYYRQELPTLEHTLEIQLKPNKAYYWAIRIRRNEKPASQWSRFVYLSNCTFIGSACAIEDFPYFLFITPASPNIAPASGV